MRGSLEQAVMRQGGCCFRHVVPCSLAPTPQNHSLWGHPGAEAAVAPSPWEGF